MNHYAKNRVASKKILYVWDGTSDFVSASDQFAKLIPSTSVTTVLAMPHESVYGYGGGLQSLAPELMTPFERKIHLSFRKCVSRTQVLKHSRLVLLFGDRVNEIAHFADVIGADLILTTRFDQSNFSKWIHGDLNQRLTQTANCPVVFLNDAQSPPGMPELKSKMAKAWLDN